MKKVSTGGSGHRCTYHDESHQRQPFLSSEDATLILEVGTRDVTPSIYHSLYEPGRMSDLGGVVGSSLALGYPAGAWEGR